MFGWRNDRRVSQSLLDGHKALAPKPIRTGIIIHKEGNDVKLKGRSRVGLGLEARIMTEQMNQNDTKGNRFTHVKPTVGLNETTIWRLGSFCRRDRNHIDYSRQALPTR